MQVSSVIMENQKVLQKLKINTISKISHLIFKKYKQISWRCDHSDHNYLCLSQLKEGQFEQGTLHKPEDNHHDKNHCQYFHVN